MSHSMPQATNLAAQRDARPPDDVRIWRTDRASAVVPDEMVTELVDMDNSGFDLDPESEGESELANEPRISSRPWNGEL